MLNKQKMIPFIVSETAFRCIWTLCMANRPNILLSVDLVVVRHLEMDEAENGNVVEVEKGEGQTRANENETRCCWKANCWLLEIWTGFTQFTKLNFQTDTCGLGSGWKKSSNAKARPWWPEICSGTLKAAQRQGKQHWATEKPKLDIAGNLRRICFISSIRKILSSKKPWTSQGVEGHHEKRAQKNGVVHGIKHILQTLGTRKQWRKPVQCSQIKVRMYRENPRIYEKALRKDTTKTIFKIVLLGTCSFRGVTTILCINLSPCLKQ